LSRSGAPRSLAGVDTRRLETGAGITVATLLIIAKAPVAAS
jgi:hypothetical protein